MYLLKKNTFVFLQVTSVSTTFWDNLFDNKLHRGSPTCAGLSQQQENILVKERGKKVDKKTKSNWKPQGKLNI